MGRSEFKLHPLFVPFPIALLFGALAADLAFRGTRDPLCAEAASWLVLGALTACALSLIAGIVDSGWSHVCATAAALLVLTIDAMAREGVEAATPPEIVLSAFAVAILLLSGASSTERAAMQKSSWRALSLRLAGR
jgi:uncharacterized membrane protein